jgi:hypothetical protein
MGRYFPAAAFFDLPIFLTCQIRLIICICFRWIHAQNKYLDVSQGYSMEFKMTERFEFDHVCLPMYGRTDLIGVKVPNTPPLRPPYIAARTPTPGGRARRRRPGAASRMGRVAEGGQLFAAQIRSARSAHRGHARRRGGYVSAPTALAHDENRSPHHHHRWHGCVPTAAAHAAGHVRCCSDGGGTLGNTAREDPPHPPSWRVLPQGMYRSVGVLAGSQFVGNLGCPGPPAAIQRPCRFP